MVLENTDNILLNLEIKNRKKLICVEEFSTHTNEIEK